MKCGEQGVAVGVNVASKVDAPRAAPDFSALRLVPRTASGTWNQSSKRALSSLASAAARGRS
jgi:hypothetical protein